MNSHDSFYRIAHGKKVCQDFATSGITNDMYFGILSDGCSGAPGSEYGAIDLVNGLEQYLYPDCKLHHAFLGACGRADAARVLRGKDRQTLYATLLCITLHNGVFKTAVGGDGYIVFRRRNTSIFEIRQIEFSKNAPFYPIYALTPDQKSFDFLQQDRIVTNTVLDVSNPKEVMSKVYTIPQEGICSTQNWFGDYDLGLIFSDGLGSFHDTNSNPVNFEEVLRVFLNFKNLRGEFIQRKMNFAWAEVDKLGWHNTDDFSVAGISYVE
jgi:hypothetical protein